MNTRVDWSVYVITDRRTVGDRSLLEVITAALRGGATVIQLRDKDLTTLDMITFGQALHDLTQSMNVPLIVNDRVDVALAINAEGVHVGPRDMPAKMARQLIGPDRMLGVSVATVADAQQAVQDGADYVGVGDLYGTPSKPDAGPPIGPERLTAIAQSIAIPIVGIGGVTLANAAAVIKAGAAGVAVISAVLGAPDPLDAAQQLRRKVTR
ncbi:MAG: thiamine phosphate synthase [Chloroflexi bacterium AL-W]|nr:thiamine phosphate synthase [Chloroflexi bacterium AL-N1]NOK71673.1 thiamine phosphate synthase [Chloroflexi bacterium AL-N10]NOK79014.1 thiamine phosphate synthase [Chloroflexi bacterium AL-N5]NOK86448.1 thiamine phosphate synthase [Chloroflexi bacterium AL-W]NOK93414.1 thiamine phosphate synthase [Chloroflexi bacterium AL-N15]